MMEFTFSCPNCGFSLQADTDWIGRKAQCCQCGTKFIIRDPGIKPPAPEPVKTPEPVKVPEPALTEKDVAPALPDQELQVRKTNKRLLIAIPLLVAAITGMAVLLFSVSGSGKKEDAPQQPAPEAVAPSVASSHLYSYTPVAAAEEQEEVVPDFTLEDGTIEPQNRSNIPDPERQRCLYLLKQAGAAILVETLKNDNLVPVGLSADSCDPEVQYEIQCSGKSAAYLKQKPYTAILFCPVHHLQIYANGKCGLAPSGRAHAK